MERKRVLLFSAILLIGVILLACDTATFTAFLDPGTATPTRTPRATFTPRATATPEETPTPEATATSVASPTPTQRVVPTARPATKAPTAPPAPPKPQFTVSLGDNYMCPQDGNVWQVIARINRSAPPPIFLGDYTLALLSPEGAILKTDQSVPDGQQVNGLWINCRVDKVFPYNWKIDAPEYRGKGPYIVRVIKSKNDPTPLSPDARVDFFQQSIWFVFFTAPQ